MSSFAFRRDFPKGPGENWDRNEIAKALRQSRTVGKMTGNTDFNSVVQGAAMALREKANFPAKKYTRKWSDNRDRDILADKLDD